MNERSVSYAYERMQDNKFKYELIGLGIQLVHKFMLAIECDPSLKDNIYLAQANNVVSQWNAVFKDIQGGI